MQRTLMWFRNDLRVEDNPALHWACARGSVIAVFCLTPGQWQAHDMALCKAGFILRTLKALQQELESRQIPLRVLSCRDFSALPEALLGLARETGCNALSFNDEYELNERRRDGAVVKRFTADGLQVQRHTDQVLFEPGTLLTGKGGFYTVFTPFRKRWRQQWLKQGSTEPLPAPPLQADTGIASDRIPTQISDFTPSPLPGDLWPAGAVEAQRRLELFIQFRANHYHQQRNFPAIAGTSELSPYLAVGAISLRQCLHAALSANDGELDTGHAGLVSWISELNWREFYKHLLVGFPRVCRHQPFKPETEHLPWRNDPQQFEAWATGRTGYPLVDAAMRQLMQTGWMHNRLRMLTAMFLSKHLLLDWRLGERFFMRHLIDGDLAANNGGWQWAASTGTDAAPYFRLFNPITQSRRFDPDGHFIRRYVPELAALDAPQIHEPQRMSTPPPDYPAPIVDHCKARERVLTAFASLPKG